MRDMRKIAQDHARWTKMDELGGSAEREVIKFGRELRKEERGSPMDEETIKPKDEAENNGLDGNVVLCSENLEDNERKIMKGDAVGDTMYSASWILRTIISLTKAEDVKFTDTLEIELCSLWDMTAQEDVVTFLLDNNFLDIAEHVLRSSKNNRLTEIILGIIGNMCCQPVVLRDVGNRKNLVVAILDLLTSDDTETLIQVLRIVRAATWDVQRNDESAWLENIRACQFFGEALLFLLQSSTNENLLTTAIDLLKSISSIKLPNGSNLLFNLVNIEGIIPALFESAAQVISEQGFYLQSQQRKIRNWLAVLRSIVQDHQFAIKKDEPDESSQYGLNLLLKILEPYVHSENLFPMEEETALCISDCVEICLWFQKKGAIVSPLLVHVILSILLILKSAVATDTESLRRFHLNHEEHFEEPEELLNREFSKELLQYLENYWVDTVGTYNKDMLTKCLKLCSNEAVKSLVQIIERNPKSSKTIVEKLRAVI
ncbi:protein saal1 [Orussus abietinus]|uniref:protein saal1 n=1 Tax=Orussus abietinus TaxID=222816 RepID=UPI0006256355|nr:protein saal1 [Orussus abietinus]